jgi:hypothetical protein
MADGISRRLGAVGAAGLAQDIVDMSGDGALTDTQHQGDIGVIAPDGDARVIVHLFFKYLETLEADRWL